MFFHSRMPGALHGSLVLSSEINVRGRVWSHEGWFPISRIRVIGRRFLFIDEARGDGPLPVFFDRQVRAFGPEIQRLLGHLHVGVVGAGGTGSAVLEQIARLGVGTISIFDGDAFDDTNVNRVYGSIASDAGRNKAEMAAANVQRMGLETILRVYPGHITWEASARHLRDCDVVFGCTDRHAPRGILVQLAIRYLIPLFDVGVRIDSQGGTLRGVFGRVTTFFPGEACLFCRGRISPEMIRLESLSSEQRQALADENYAPELEGPAPAVIAFTTAVAAQAVSEFLQRLTGFMGPDRKSTEAQLLLSESRLRTNRETAGPECLCSRASCGVEVTQSDFWTSPGQIRAMRRRGEAVFHWPARCWQSIRIWWRRKRRYTDFCGVVFVDPGEDPTLALRDRKLVLVGSPQRPKWLRFMCPCRCGQIIALNLMASHSPRWAVEMHPDQTVTVHPSVDATACGSHFWVRRSRVEWV